MTTGFDVDYEVETPPIEITADGSVLDLIRARRESAAAEHEYDMVVPGYGELLVLRCTPPNGATLTQLRERIERSKDPERDFVLAADVLARSCEQVLARRTPTSPLEPIDPSGEPCRLEQRLAQLLAIEAPTVRALIRALFDKSPSPESAAAKAVGAFLAWAQGEDLDVDEALLGES